MSNQCDNVKDYGEIRDLKGYEGYSITSKGYVLYNGFPCKFFKCGKYKKLVVAISTEQVIRRLCVDKLVANTFLGEQPSNYTVYHKDGDIYNNDISNLGYRAKDWSKLNNAERVNHHTVLKAIEIKTGTEQKFNSFKDFYNYLIDNKGYHYSYSTMYERIRKVGVVCGFKVRRIDTERVQRLREGVNKMEIREIVGSDGYVVTSTGEVRHGDKVLKPIERKVDGFYVVNIAYNGVMKTTLVHALVAKTFLKGINPNTTIHHKDGNKANNDVSNLEIKPRRRINSMHIKVTNEVTGKVMNFGSYIEFYRYIRQNHNYQHSSTCMIMNINRGNKIGAFKVEKIIRERDRVDIQ